MRGIFRRIIITGIILCVFVCAAEKTYFLPDLLKAADENNPAIQAEKITLKRYAEEIRLANLGWIPDFTLSHGVYTDDSGAVDNGRTYNSFGINISKLFSQGSRVQIARENYARQEQELAAARARVYQQINDAYQNYVQRQKRLEILKRSYQAAQNNLTIVRRNFASGNLQPDRVIVSQEIVSNFELRIEEEQSALAKLDFQIKTLTGQAVNDEQ
ncbi:MAG: TolC family protein [Candidatus Margulisbacteria bacterium]|jgi:outer membrane protein TolC|nr:TolC family protein [Candidatus Margulisiibacteriota bacterium]